MAPKNKLKLILELRASGLSRNAIAKTRHISKLSVSDVMHRADELAVTHEDVKNKSDDEIYRLLYPEKSAIASIYKNPDYAYIHSELKKVGVTLKLLWQEYVAECKRERELPMGYTKYCDGYAKHTLSNSLTNHLRHKPGISVEVDWSGPTMEIVNPTTGETAKVFLFVATLPFSQYSYVEPCLDMKEETWLRCHVRMFTFFGGSTVRIVCDNLKTGVIRHPKDGDIVLNDRYEALGSHYVAAVMPTDVRKPKQKASVEGTVGKVATAIIAKLRNVRFFSLNDLESAVSKALGEFNGAPFQKRQGSRLEVFSSEEKPCLRVLPPTPYEIAEWHYGRAVALDCHVVHAKNRYSCPYQYVGKKADVKVSGNMLEIYCGGERIATHRKLPSYVSGGWSTHEEDMPDRFQRPEWDDGRIKRWAHSIGPCTGETIERIFAGVKIREQGYNSSLSVLRLSKTYSETRLEAACEFALTKIKSPRYNHLKSILAPEQDKVFAQREEAREDRADEYAPGYVRGAAYYGGSGDDE
ncbi:MAG: IS21 family transposase [Clostridiales Family XIII bacterium]|jgi:transposase|nr:IS21 family transposase [Clostridiales Family XIII bacterium]